MINPGTINIFELPSLPLGQRSLLPATPSIYFALDSLGNIQYIGRSTNLQNRWVNHHRCGQLNAIGGITIAWLTLDSPELLVDIETALIKWFNPPLNRSEVVTDKKQISVYLEPDVKVELDRLARKRKRSVNSLVEILVEREIKLAKEHGEMETADAG